MATEMTNGGSAKKSPAKNAARKVAAKKVPVAPVAEVPAPAAPASVHLPAVPAPAAPAPAAKSAPGKKAATKKTAAETTALPVAKPAKKAVKKATAHTPLPLTRSVGVQKPETSVLVKCDAGYGNTFFLRGSGPGLSWEQGIAMECVAADEWLWTTSDASSPFEVKVLLNDQTWQSGENTIVTVGAKCVIEPSF